MSDTSTTQPETTDEPPLIKELREQVATRVPAEDHEAIVRENAFLRAGIDIDSDEGKALLGSNLDIEAAKTLALKAGVLKGETPPAAAAEDGTATAPEDKGQAGERAALATASTQPGAIEQRDPRTVGLEEFQKELANGAQRDDAAAQFVDRVIDAAAKGDKRVLFDQNEWNRRAAASEVPAS